MIDRYDFLKCYEGCFPKIKKLVIITLGKYYLEGDEEDIFQDALVILFENLRNSEFRITTDVCGYLYGTARNLSQVLRRKRERGQNYKEGFDKDNHGEIYSDDLDEKSHTAISKVLEKCIEKLPETKKKMMLARYWKKLSMDEIASMFEFSAAVNVRMQIHRAINNLRDCVKQTIKLN